MGHPLAVAPTPYSHVLHSHQHLYGDHLLHARSLSLRPTTVGMQMPTLEGGVGRTFAGMIAGKQWHAERYNVYVMPNGSLCMDGHDPLTLLKVAPRLRLRPSQGCHRGGMGMGF